MSADERLAIWRYATPEERQRVIDAPEGWGPEHGIQVPLNVFMRDEEPCCPWGAAFITNWDKCNIAPRDLIAYLRRLNDVEATQ